MARTQITLDSELQRRARRRATQLGVSFAEYVRRVVARDLGDARSTRDLSTIFDLGASNASDVARDKDRMIGEAVAAGRAGRRRRR